MVLVTGPRAGEGGGRAAAATGDGDGDGDVSDPGPNSPTPATLWISCPLLSETLHKKSPIYSRVFFRTNGVIGSFIQYISAANTVIGGVSSGLAM